MTSAVVNLVRQVGQLLVSWRTSGGTDGAWEGTQFHANADRWAHERLCQGLAALDASVPVVSEEDRSATGTGADVYWLIDPIDGTASYAEGFDGFVTQVALMEQAQPVLAVVCAPVHQHLYVATAGGGATLNGERLPRARTSGLTLIDNDPTPRGVAADLYREMSFSHYLESGSIGLKICRVADGTADVFFKAVTVRDWDLAAPHLVLQEAGGCLVGVRGERISYGVPRTHHGIVAGRDDNLVRRVVTWHEAHLSRTSAT